MSFSTFSCSKSERLRSIICCSASLFFLRSFMISCMRSRGISLKSCSISSISFFISSGMTSSKSLFISSCFFTKSSLESSFSLMKSDSSFCSSWILFHSSWISFCFSISSFIFSLSLQSRSFFDIRSRSMSSISLRRFWSSSERWLRLSSIWFSVLSAMESSCSVVGRTR